MTFIFISMEYKQISQMGSPYPTGLNYKSEGGDTIGIGIEYEEIPFEVIDVNTIQPPVANPPTGSTQQQTLELYPFNEAGSFIGEVRGWIDGEYEYFYEWTSTGWQFDYSEFIGPS